MDKNCRIPGTCCPLIPEVSHIKRTAISWRASQTLQLWTNDLIKNQFGLRFLQRLKTKLGGNVKKCQGFGTKEDINKGSANGGKDKNTGRRTHVYPGLFPLGKRNTSFLKRGDLAKVCYWTINQYFKILRKAKKESHNRSKTQVEAWLCVLAALQAMLCLPGAPQAQTKSVNTKSSPLLVELLEDWMGLSSSRWIWLQHNSGFFAPKWCGLWSSPLKKHFRVHFPVLRFF